MYPEACAAVNGLVGDILCGSEDVKRTSARYRQCPNMNCIRTRDSDYRAWWRVDLQRVYTVYSGEIWLGKGQLVSFGLNFFFIHLN